MGRIIGQTYPVGDKFAPNDNGRTVHIALQDIIDFHNTWIAPLLAEYADDAEADLLLVIDEESTVLDVQLLRIKTDEDKDGRVFGNTDGKATHWVKSIVDYAHSVEGMRSFWVLHRHPNINPNPSDRDERLANVVAALDFLYDGAHPGTQRHFHGMSVFTQVTTMPIGDDIDHTGIMEIDVLIAEGMADAYEDAFDDNPIAVQQRVIADAIRELFDASDEQVPDPMVQMKFKFTVEMPALMAQAAAAMELGEEEFKRLLEESAQRMADAGELRDRYLDSDEYEAPLRAVGGTPEAVAQTVLDAFAEAEDEDEEVEEEKPLHPGILADLATFDFSQLDT